jgi:hypothetical protein
MPEHDTGPFGVVDPRLTIYALANGMDLVKEAGTRRLEWYRDGRERGILIAVADGGSLQVTAQAWTRGSDASLTTVPQGAPHAPSALSDNLSAILDPALDAANAL